MGNLFFQDNSQIYNINLSKEAYEKIKLSRDKKLNCPEPILIIIGGYKDNWSINARLYVNSQEIIMNPK